MEENFSHELTPGCYPPSDSDEESFVVLEKSSLDSNGKHFEEIINEMDKLTPIPADEIDDTLDLTSNLLARSQVTEADSHNCSRMSASTSTITRLSSSDFQNEEFYEKVVTLINENTKLKDMIDQNNIAMRTQFDTLAKWQAEVVKVQEEQKKTFSDMKDYIKMLQNENQILRSSHKEIPPKVSNGDSEENSFKIKFYQLQEELKQKQAELLKLQKSYENVCAELKSKTALIADQSVKLNKMAELESNLAKAEDLIKTYRSSNEHVDVLSLQLSSAQQKLLQKLQQITVLENKLAESNALFQSANEQIKAFEEDFHTERRIKDQLIVEKNELAEKMQDLLSRNENLLTKIEQYQNVQVPEVASTSSTASSTNADTRNESFMNQTNYTCPCCYTSFRGYNQLDQHMQTCGTPI